MVSIMITIVVDEKLMERSEWNDSMLKKNSD
jgi:hypothetical protein